MAQSPLSVRDLGQLDYAAALELQHALVAERAADHIPDTLLLVEHPPVITLGRRRDSAGHVLTPGATPIVQVERGGDVTWHGPGQLVGYPIFSLRPHERDVHLVLRRLEDALIAVVTDSGLDARRREGHTGVWARGLPSTDVWSPPTALSKVASLGIAIRDWVTFHGFALNVDCDLTEFTRIQPCGLEAAVMGSLAALGARPEPPRELRRRVADAIAQSFGRATM